MISPGPIGDVMSVGHRLRRKCPDVRVIARIEDEVSLPSLRDKTQLAKLTKVLGDGRRRDTDVLGEIVHGVLSVQQRPQDAEPGLDRYDPQQLGCFDELVSGGSGTYLSSHADSLDPDAPAAQNGATIECSSDGVTKPVLTLPVFMMHPRLRRDVPRGGKLSGEPAAMWPTAPPERPSARDESRASCKDDDHVPNTHPRWRVAVGTARYLEVLR